MFIFVAEADGGSLVVDTDYPLQSQIVRLLDYQLEHLVELGRLSRSLRMRGERCPEWEHVAMLAGDELGSRLADDGYATEQLYACSYCQPFRELPIRTLGVGRYRVECPDCGAEWEKEPGLPWHEVTSGARNGSR